MALRCKPFAAVAAKGRSNCALKVATEAVGTFSEVVQLTEWVGD